MLPEPTAGSTIKSPRGSTRLHQSVGRPGIISYSRVNTKQLSAGRCARTGILKPLKS